jgi:hypothetical protein
MSRSLHPLRITTVPGKLAFIALAGGYIVLSNYIVLPVTRAPNEALIFHWTVAILVFIVVGVRVFRGRGEPVAPARPWWKASARPTASWVIGGLSLVDLALAVVWLLATGPIDVDDSYAQILHILSALLTSALYVNSAIRLTIAERVVNAPRVS